MQRVKILTPTTINKNQLKHGEGYLLAGQQGAIGGLNKNRIETDYPDLFISGDPVVEEFPGRDPADPEALLFHPFESFIFIIRLGHAAGKLLIRRLGQTQIAYFLTVAPCQLIIGVMDLALPEPPGIIVVPMAPGTPLPAG